MAGYEARMRRFEYLENVRRRPGEHDGYYYFIVKHEATKDVWKAKDIHLQMHRWTSWQTLKNYLTKKFPDCPTENMQIHSAFYDTDTYSKLHMVQRCDNFRGQKRFEDTQLGWEGATKQILVVKEVWSGYDAMAWAGGLVTGWVVASAKITVCVALQNLFGPDWFQQLFCEMDKFQATVAEAKQLVMDSATEQVQQHVVAKCQAQAAVYAVEIRNLQTGVTQFMEEVKGKAKSYWTELQQKVVDQLLETIGFTKFKLEQTLVDLNEVWREVSNQGLQLLLQKMISTLTDWQGLTGGWLQALQ